jgi:phosphatidate cytidylyltransferase
MNLLLRVVSGAVLLAIVTGALWVGTATLALLIGAGVLLAAWEFSGLAARLELRPPGWLLYPLTLWLALRVLVPGGYGGAEWALYAAVVLGLAASVAAGVDFRRFAMAVAGACWLGLSLGAYLALYQTGPSGPAHTGLRDVALAVIAVVVCDTAAYFAGSAFGRHRFFPSISPTKSLEGAVAGLLAAVLVTAVLSQPLAGRNPGLGAALGALIAVAAQAGDLVESALKRRAGVKDSSGLIPGHGGLLDRVDSLVLVGPVVYCCLKLVT